VSVDSILNQPSLSSLGHDHADLPEIGFLFFTPRTPVHVPTVLELSGGYTGFTCRSFRAS
jgi:hypothetical protein